MMKKWIVLCGMVGLCLLPFAAVGQTNGEALMQRLESYRYGGDRAVLDAVAQWVSESRPDAARRHAAAAKLTGFLTSNAAFDAKEFACRQLVLVASEEDLPALAQELDNPELAHYVLMVMARIPGEEVNKVLRGAVALHHDATGLEIIDMLGERQDRDAIDLLVPALDSDETFAAAAYALAKIATPRASELLRKAYATQSASRRDAAANALLLNADRARAAGDASTAEAAYTTLNGDANPVVNGAALRGLVKVRGEQALPLIVQALHEDHSRRQAAAIDALRDMPGRQVTLRLAAILPQLTPYGQQLLLAALANRADRAAAPAVVALCHSTDTDVRAAALTALGSVGDVSSVGVLLAMASSGDPAQRALARASLVALRGTAVDARLAQSLTHGTPPLMIEAVQALSARGTATGAMLLPMARSARRAESAAALRALQDIGQPVDLPQLVALMLATPAGSRDDAIETAAAVARRGTDEAQRTGALLTALRAQSSVTDRVDLLTILAHVGGPRALAALRQAAAERAPELQSAALRLMADWETDEPLADLLHACRLAPNPTIRAIALRGYLRMIALNEERPQDKALQLYRDAAHLARTTEEKRQLLAGVQKLTSLAGLELASGYLSDATVRPEAEAAVVQIGRSTLGAWPEETRKALEPLARNAVNEAARNGAAETLARMSKFGDFVMAWELSPAYQQDGADYLKLFDIAFPPEKGAQADATPWRLMPVGANPDQPWLLDILAVWPGEQRVAYLRTAVYSESARDLTLELGSDDGIKVWWNNEVVLAHNTARAVAPAEEKVTVHMKQGWNPLLLKITQNNQGWGACARFTNPDGSPATGLRYRIPSARNANGTITP